MSDEPKTQEEIPPSQVGKRITIPIDDIPTEPLRCQRCGDTYQEHVENGCNGNDGNCECTGFEGYP